MLPLRLVKLQIYFKRRVLDIDWIFPDQVTSLTILPSFQNMQRQKHLYSG